MMKHQRDQRSSRITVRCAAVAVWLPFAAAAAIAQEEDGGPRVDLNVPTLLLLKSYPVAVTDALSDRLIRETGRGRDDTFRDVAGSRRRSLASPCLTTRSPDELIGYQEDGLPT